MPAPVLTRAGGPNILLDRRAASPRTPTCPAASQTTPEGPRSGWRRISLHRGNLTPQGQSPVRLVTRPRARPAEVADPVRALFDPCRTESHVCGTSRVSPAALVNFPRSRKRERVEGDRLPREGRPISRLASGGAHQLPRRTESSASWYQSVVTDGPLHVASRTGSTRSGRRGREGANPDLAGRELPSRGQVHRDLRAASAQILARNSRTASSNASG